MIRTSMSLSLRASPRATDPTTRTLLAPLACAISTTRRRLRSTRFSRSALSALAHGSRKCFKLGCSTAVIDGATGCASMNLSKAGQALSVGELHWWLRVIGHDGRSWSTATFVRVTAHAPTESTVRRARRRARDGSHQAYLSDRGREDACSPYLSWCIPRSAGEVRTLVPALRIRAGISAQESTPAGS